MDVAEDDPIVKRPEDDPNTGETGFTGRGVTGQNGPTEEGGITANDPDAPGNLENLDPATADENSDVAGKMSMYDIMVQQMKDKGISMSAPSDGKFNLEDVKNSVNEQIAIIQKLNDIYATRHSQHPFTPDQLAPNMVWLESEFSAVEVRKMLRFRYCIESCTQWCEDRIKWNGSSSPKAIVRLLDRIAILTKFESEMQEGIDNPRPLDQKDLDALTQAQKDLNTARRWRLAQDVLDNVADELKRWDGKDIQEIKTLLKNENKIKK